METLNEAYTLQSINDELYQAISANYQAEGYTEEEAEELAAQYLQTLTETYETGSEDELTAEIIETYLAAGYSQQESEARAQQDTAAIEEANELETAIIENYLEYGFSLEEAESLAAEHLEKLGETTLDLEEVLEIL